MSDRDDLPQTSKHGAPEGRGVCRSCRAPIIFVRTPRDRLMPVDEATDESHFSSCDDPDRFRKARGGSRETAGKASGGSR